MVAFNISGLILCLGLLLAAPPRATASEGTAEPGTNAPISIQVQSADGKPLPHAVVVCFGSSAKATLNGTEIQGGSERFQTDGEGRFTLPPNGKNIAVAVADVSGFCLMQTRDFTNHPTMTVQP